MSERKSRVVLYDFVAPAYDAVLESIYLPFRRRALDFLPKALGGAIVLDLACGTGQNFPLLAGRMGAQGRLIGVDVSRGMLRWAARSAKRAGIANVALLNLDASGLSSAELEERSGVSSVDFIVCTYGFTAMRDPETAFQKSFALLKPGGGYLIHDIGAKKRTVHSRLIEIVTRCDFSREEGVRLQNACADFRMEYLDPSTHLFGGRLFVAYGTKSGIVNEPCER